MKGAERRQVVLQPALASEKPTFSQTRVSVLGDDDIALDPPESALQSLPRATLASIAALAFGSGFVHRQDVSTEF